MRYSVAEYVVQWLYYDMKEVKKMADLSQNVFLSDGRMEKLMIAKGNDAMHCISPNIFKRFIL